MTNSGARTIDARSAQIDRSGILAVRSDKAVFYNSTVMAMAAEEVRIVRGNVSGAEGREGHHRRRGQDRHLRRSGDARLRPLVDARRGRLRRWPWAPSCSCLARFCAGSSASKAQSPEGVMGMLGRLGSFIAGGLLGAGVGAAVATLVAPQSGDKFRRELEQSLDQAKVAGLEAQATHRRRTDPPLPRRNWRPRRAARPGDANARRNSTGHRRAGEDVESGVRESEVGSRDTRLHLARSASGRGNSRTRWR